MNKKIKPLCACGCRRRAVVMGYAEECLKKKHQQWEVDERKSIPINYERQPVKK